MDRPESSPAYLESALPLSSMPCEADAMARGGNIGPELSDLLQHAAELVDIIAEGLQGCQGASAPLADVETLRGMLRSMRGLLDRPDALH